MPRRVSAQTMMASRVPKSRVQRARRSIPSFDSMMMSRWGWRLAPVGATRPASRMAAKFSASTFRSRYWRQAYRFLASSRKSILAMYLRCIDRTAAPRRAAVRERRYAKNQHPAKSTSAPDGSSDCQSGRPLRLAHRLLVVGGKIQKQQDSTMKTEKSELPRRTSSP